MYFKEIELKNFRNYEYCREFFSPEINIFIGENGQGKTSLVEALYIMCLGRSFRTQKDKDMIKFGETSAVIRSVVYKNERNIRTEIVINENEKKRIKINGIPKKKSDLSNNILIVVFSPEDLKIVKEDPEKRRRYINREISQLYPSYYEALVRYTKILNQRNTLIKTGNVNRIHLKVWDDELIKYGSRIIFLRERFIERLSIISANIHSEITEGKEELKIEYDGDISFNENINEIINEFEKKLNFSFSKDMARGITSHGPHRDDIKITINDVDVRKYGSQGQQRTAALSLKLAEIKLIEEEIGENPVLILDDVLSELDMSRQNYLIQSLKGVQVFLTSTSISDEIADKFEEKIIFEIKEGKVINKV
ncbi:MAG: DNA replication/repair protein RecF [Firmicutes bacterium]|nr:DNA replication/repair protein RecF [Bacillota bacterium]